jgi:DNA-directed RNA polymerase specialized sigma24 family protein
MALIAQPTESHKETHNTHDLAQEASVLTHVAFSRLLEWLDDGTDSCGRTYLEMRRLLVAYFDRRHRPFADELADDTLNRIGRTLERSGSIAARPPARYCHVVAKFVLLEDIRRGRRSICIDPGQRLASFPSSWSRHAAVDDDTSIREQRLACLDRCLETLKPDQRELAIEYYRDDNRARIERRREMARRLRITTNALGIRVSRIRNALEACMGSRTASGRDSRSESRSHHQSRASCATTRPTGCAASR